MFTAKRRRPESTRVASKEATEPKMTTYSRLSALDRSFLDLEDRNIHMHVGATCVFDVGPLASPGGGIDIERVRAYVESRLHLIPRYRQHIARVPLDGHPEPLRTDPKRQRPRVRALREHTG
jgi:hypothetical protein